MARSSSNRRNSVASIKVVNTTVLSSTENDSKIFSIPIQLCILYLNVALYAAAYQMQQPSQPFMVESLSKSNGTFDYGLFRSYFQGLQVIGSLIAGYLIDRLGAKWVIALTFFVSALSYQMTAFATTLPLLYASMIPTILQHTVLGSRAYVSVSTTDEVRAQYIGYIMVAYGVGMVIGPTIGGVLSSGGNYWLVSTVAACLSLLSFFIVIVFQKEPLSSLSTELSSKSTSTVKKPINSNDYYKMITDPSVFRLLIVKFLFTGAGALFHSVFQVVAAQRFGFDVKGMGFVLSYVGALTIVSNLVVSFAKSQLSDYTLLVSCGVVLLSSYIAFAASYTAMHLYLLCIPMVVASGIFQAVSAAQLASFVRSELTGTATALDMGIGSGVRMISPVLASSILSEYGFSSVGLTSGGLMSLAVLILFFITPVAAVKVKR
jgi:predicted MFS family arabinose efflux permease